MINLDQVTVLQPGTKRAILRDVSLHIGPRERVGIIAATGSGKTTIARLLSGIEGPDRGRVNVSNVSWPLGYAGFLHPNLSVAENLRLMARLLGQDPVGYAGRVCHLAEVSYATQIRDLAPSQRAILAYMCAMAVPGRMLIADDTLTVGDTQMRRKCEALLKQRFATNGLVFLSRNPRQMRQFCTRIFALTQGCLIPCETSDRAQFLLMKEAEYV